MGADRAWRCSIWRRDASEGIKPLSSFQADFVGRRFGLAPSLALAVAELAFAHHSVGGAHERDALLSRETPRRQCRGARIQAAIVEWVRTVAPDLFVFHPPNGGLRGFPKRQG